jgi:hypothetical protein
MHGVSGGDRRGRFIRVQAGSDSRRPRPPGTSLNQHPENLHIRLSPHCSYVNAGHKKGCLILMV